MDRIFFEGIRCFHDFHSCPIKPITLLIGENSSGKTTFLALTRIAWDIANRGDLSEDLFNQEPFILGSYDQLASFRGGRAGRAKSFTIGMRVGVKLRSTRTKKGSLADEASITARFIPQGSEPRLNEWKFECGKYSLIAKKLARQDQIEVTVKTPKGTFKPAPRISIPFPRLFFDFAYMMISFGDSRDKPGNHENLIPPEELSDLRNIYSQISRSLGQRPHAFAPIRTRPQRTYDPLKAVYDPEGSHIPMVLNKNLSEKSESNKLHQAIDSFGKTSGLFNSIRVKRKGSKDSDPFQIGVKTFGPMFNLIDVGYGVSQILPIIVDIVQNPSTNIFLLQQPEVHLHPKAQAELGSFLASLSKRQGKQFIIETHSDYLLDRIRMEVRDDNIKSDDVVILYFEKSQGGVKIHELTLDKYGNILNAPPTYRQFFLEEERRMLGI